MIKEFILAITLGAILGFGITGSIFALTKSKSTSPPKITPIATTSIEPGTTSTPNSLETLPTSSANSQSTENSLTITFPANNSIVTNSKITLKGNAQPGGTITVSTSVKAFSTNVNSSGSFSIDIDLESGANILNISSIDTNDSQSDQQILVTYSTAKI